MRTRRGMKVHVACPASRLVRHPLRTAAKEGRGFVLSIEGTYWNGERSQALRPLADVQGDRPSCG